LELKGKVAIVTGGSSGIGEAISQTLAKEGASVAIADIKTGSTAEKIRDGGGEATFIQTDVRKENDVKRFVEETLRRYGQVDILCNNAGVELVRPLVETTTSDWERVIDTNLKGVFLFSREVLPHMMKRKEGLVVNIASQLGLVGLPGLSAYCASKGAVITMTKAMALECARFGVRVNAVCPGAIDTPMVQREVNLESDPAAARHDMIGRHPLGRLGRSDEIAQAVLFLSTPRSSFITGHSLVADGGYTIS
jgi:meso-butanediol dehydrogenase / (S,S)-butanediol dehydrogenase / diacetyl reductase